MSRIRQAVLDVLQLEKKIPGIILTDADIARTEQKADAIVGVFARHLQREYAYWKEVDSEIAIGATGALANVIAGMFVDLEKQ